MKRPVAGVLLLLAALVLAFAGRYLVGSSGFGWPADEVARYRGFAACTAVAVGAALAIAGLFLQVLLRNPLASPFVLGLSSGAGFGYMLALWIGWRFGSDLSGGVGGWLGLAGPVLLATVGSLVVLALVWRLGVRHGTPDPLSLVLAGVVVSAIAGAATTALQSIVPSGLRGDFVGWMMGRIPELPPTGPFLLVVGLVALGLMLGVWLGPALDAASTSDDEAASMGVPLAAIRRTLFVVAGVLAASTVALAGPIAFVGLVGPHAARLVVGARHRTLVVASSLAGAALLVAADAVRQSVDLGGGRLPVGVVTAMVGGPIFLWLLRALPFAGRGEA